jgi:hypothetical protein
MNLINGAWPVNVRDCCHSVTIGDMDDDEPGAETVHHGDGTMSGQIRIPTGEGKGIIATTSPVTDQIVATAKTANLLADVAQSIAKNPEALKQLAYLNPVSAAAVTLYSQPDVRKALKNVGKGASSLFHKFF